VTTIESAKFEPILVWRFEQAPEQLRELSNNGGDEDWIAEVPPSLANEYIGWLESGSSFGCFDVSEYDHPSQEKAGWKVYIGAHA